MIVAGEFTFEIFRRNQNFRLRVSLPLARSGLEGAITENDLLRLGGFFTPAPKADSNGMDLNLVDRIVTTGVRALAKSMHPDTESGSNEEMAKLNNTAEQIREKLRR